MFKSYFIIGRRNLIRNKGYSLINIGGLAVGLTVSFLIGLWIFDETSFNKVHENYSRIGRVMEHRTIDGEVSTSMNMPIPLSAKLRSSFSNDFEFIVLSTPSSEHILSSGDNQFLETGNYMEPDAPNLLSLKMLKGTGTSLTDLNSILISESIAKKLFGDSDPINQLVRIDNKMDTKVSGVYRDLPLNSEFSNVMFIAPWELFLSNETWFNEQRDDWTSNFFQIYVKLAAQKDFGEVTSKIQNTMLPHLEEACAEQALFLHPMNKWHLHSAFKNGVTITSEAMKFVWLYGMIGLSVLFLACINFMNLTTARSERRSREVGIRKSVGSARRQLITQFLVESVLTVLIAFLLSIVMIELSLPWFNALVDKNLRVPWESPILWLLSISFLIITGLIAGSYPAFYLSSFQPIKTLKGIFNAGRFASTPRKVLVTFQFIISVSLMIGAIVIYQQIRFSKNRPVGYVRDRLLYVDLKSDEIHNHFEAIRNELIKSGAITEIAESNMPVTKIYSSNTDFEWKGKTPSLQYNLGGIQVSHDFGKVIGWKIKEGRDFSSKFRSDSAAVIINESASRLIGFVNPVGQTIQRKNRNYQIVGVVEDMVMQSPYTPTIPTIISVLSFPGRVVSIKLKPNFDVGESLRQIEKVFKAYSPGMPFDYKFADEEYFKKFAAEERIEKFAYLFAALAIFISCLGLLGLATYITEQRTKEIGIRKILGASVPAIWKMLSNDFLVLVIISCVIAIPISFYCMTHWLQNYEYRTEISVWTFVAASGVALFITLLTVSIQTLKSAFTNPVKSLRSE